MANIYLIKEELLPTMTEHEQIDMQINISKALKAYKNVIDRMFHSIENMDNKQLLLHKEEIQDSINRIDFKLYAFNIGIEVLFWFWKEGSWYEGILEKLKQKGFQFEI